MISVLLSLALSTGCRSDKDVEDTAPVALADDDNDGFAVDVDCNDLDAGVNPDAIEVCDGVDNNCDEQVDEGLGQTLYADADGDGYGDANVSQESCEAPLGWVLNADDCDDADPAFHPGAAEADCADPADYNCDGSVGYADGDGDGFAACEDCDDSLASANPDGTETCDDVDNDCNGLVDDSASDAGTYYQDADADGYGDARIFEAACDQPLGFVADNTDCDDLNASSYPGNTETCDGVDNDCDGDVDTTAIDQTTYYADADADGYGDLSTTQDACERPSTYVENSSDCDDANAKTNPGSYEVCDGLDNDCDGIVDDSSAINVTAWYPDADSDGYGEEGGTSVDACDQPTGYVADASDCDDSESTVSPAASEVCDSVDNDCDGLTDDDSAIDGETYYADADGDGYGDASSTSTACSVPTGYAEDDGDCLDSDSDVYPSNGCEADCQELYDDGWTTSGSYVIDPDGVSTGEDPIEVYCDQDEDGGGWTRCAALTKGYVPLEMMHDEDMYAFQARLNSDNNYVFEGDAPASTTDSWNNSEDLNYGQFCRLMGSQTETWVEWKSWNYGNNYGVNTKNSVYDLEKSGTFSGNLFTEWFSDSSAARTFTNLTGDVLTVISDDNGYGNTYVQANVGWNGSSALQYTQSGNPWGYSLSGVSCSGCAHSGAGYATLPYGSTTVLNDLTHSFWTGMSSPEEGWNDCTANGNCSYHESGFGVWVFHVR
ncbi:MAG: hypothetical protein ACI9VR_002219 [Cognaticolwellia sp.]|jgi:hypothetical protein